MSRRDELQAAVAAVPYWWHSIDLGEGVVTPGHKGGPEFKPADELARLKLPDLAGRSVLDIGTWDGYYAFAAERAGASRVVALDHFVWQAFPGGSAGFDTAHAALDSRVEKVEADFMELDLNELGSFDVVLFIGVLYHLEAPLEAIRRLRAVTRDLAIIESEMVFVPGHPNARLLEFYPHDELGGDSTNWFSPTNAALHGMCSTAGFRSSMTIQGPPSLQYVRQRKARNGLAGHYRGVIHAQA